MAADETGAAKARRAPDLRELGRAGTQIWVGQITEDPNAALQGLKGLRIYQQMGFEPACAALHAAHVLPIRSTRWFMEPPDDDPKSEEIADFVHYNLWEFGSQSFDDIVRQQMGGSLQYGFSVAEQCWDTIIDGKFAGKWGWEKLAWRSQLSRWRWDVDEIDTPSGGRRRQLIAFTQLAAPTYQEIAIPADKLVLHVNELLGENFDGQSLYRPCYTSWQYLTTLRRIQAIGLERAYMGIPDVTLPSDYSDAELAAGKEIVENVRTHENAGVVHPEQVGLSVLFNKLEANAMQEAIATYRRDILLARLAAYLELGSGNVGSYALSEDQSDLFLMALNGHANYFAEVFNLWPCIPQLVSLNYPDVPSEKMPRLVHGDIGQRNLDKLGRFMAAAGQWGFLTPDDPTEDALREQLDLPERDANLTPEALRDLIERVIPTETAPGRPHTARPAPGARQQGQGLGAVNAQQAANTSPSQPQAGSAQMAEAFARTRWERPQGRLTATDRTRIRATELLLDALGDMRSPGDKPERPSVVAAKRRRPYRIWTGSRPRSMEGQKLHTSPDRVIAAEPHAGLHRKEDSPPIVIGRKHEAKIRDIFLGLKDRKR